MGLPASAAPKRSAPAARLTAPGNEDRRCPHCGSHRVAGHGAFERKDGTRQPRQLCRGCGRTSNQNTGTPLAYLKKRNLWDRFGETMARAFFVRQTAAALGIHKATAFRWRHRLLAPVSDLAQPRLAGRVAAGHVFVPYSEKGRRQAKASKGPRFRRFIDGKPAFVLMASDTQSHTAVMVGRGRPAPADLQARISDMLRPGSELWVRDLHPYSEACRRLGVVCRQLKLGRPESQPLFAQWDVDKLHGSIRGWLLHFRGVATRYLPNYLAWHRFAAHWTGLPPGEAGRRLLQAAAAASRARLLMT